MLKLKLQYFSHLIRRGNLVEKTLILGKTEGKKEKRAAEDEVVREHHQLPEPTQTHIHRIGDAIQPSHPLSYPSPPLFNFPSIEVFSNE